MIVLPQTRGVLQPPAIPLSGETMFGTAIPAVTQFGYGATLGMRFYADVDGSVIKLRFRCAPAQAGQVSTGIYLWTDAGANLVTEGIFSPVLDWNEVTLASPVAITANDIYVVGYATSTGFNIYDTSLSSPINNGSHLFSAGSGYNGVYVGGVGFPNLDAAGQNYYADIEFVPD